MLKSYIYIIVASLTILFIRILPATLIKKPIKNVFVRSFLYYVPYITLALMTFPAIINDPGSKIAGIIAFIIGLILSYKNAGLPKVAGACCLSVLITELIIRYM